VQSLLGGLPLRDLLARRRARPLLAVAKPEVLECEGARLLGFYSPCPGPRRGLVVLLHGWEGSVDSRYMLATGALAHRSGYDVFRLNFRDHGATHALNEGLFHSCRLDEVVGAVARIIERHPAPKTALIGYSLGGNFALRVAARAGRAQLPLDRIIAVCPVLCPRSTMLALDSGLWIYRRHFLRKWRRSLLAKAAAFPKLYRFGDLNRFRTLTATTEFFVERYTEFGGLEAYLDGYALTGDVLTELQVPSRLIAASDDPVIPSVDLARIARPPALEVTVAPGGGHCAFIESLALRSWLDRELVAELDAL
jgi:uncharacterized protein